MNTKTVSDPVLVGHKIPRHEAVRIRAAPFEFPVGALPGIAEEPSARFKRKVPVEDYPPDRSRRFHTYLKRTRVSLFQVQEALGSFPPRSGRGNGLSGFWAPRRIGLEIDGERC